MKFFRLVSEYRWPIYLGGLLAMSVVACGVIVWVATRPDAPRPIKGYYEAARAWDADEAVEEASRQLGWTVRYELPADVPHFAGMPRPVDVRVADRDGKPVSGLAGRLFAIRPSDTRLNQAGELVALPQHAGQLPDARAHRRAGRVGTAHRRRSRTRSGSSTRPGSTVAAGAGRPGRGAAVTRPLAARRPSAAVRRARTAASRCPPSLVRDGDAEQFCCNGCRQVLHAGPRVGVRPVLPARRSAAGRARARPRHGPQLRGLRRRARCRPRRPTASAPDRCRTRLYLEGVHCAACVWLVEKLPAVLPGVDEVRLNYGSAVAEITWRPGRRASRRSPARSTASATRRTCTARPASRRPAASRTAPRSPGSAWRRPAR